MRELVQSFLDDTRARVAAGAPAPDPNVLRGQVLATLAAAQTEGLIGVINATGVLLHTNFGRAPLSQRALRAVAELGAGYTNLEYDLSAGERGSRYARVARPLRALTGAEDALVVNNCAAAVLLVLDTFARDREVVVSRGQLIEIGGGFRLPEVLERSGARLVEVGTTNKTYPRDYRDAWNERTALFMRTHPSNYRVSGFVAEVGAQSMAALAKELGVVSFEDLGSGALVDVRRFGLDREPTVAEEIAAGMDLVAFSGDKLLGGPQCGVVCGRAELVAALRRNPLLRALRVDKMTLAALSATLASYLEPGKLLEIPLYAMLAATAEDLRARSHAVAERVADECVGVCETASTTGGGTLPLSSLPSAGLKVLGGAGLARRLRGLARPVVGRIEDDALLLDLRTVDPADDETLAAGLAAALRGD